MAQGYTHSHRILVAVDCIIFGFDGDEIKILLVKRHLEPEKGNWALMGGLLKENENIDEAAKRVLFELTGLDDVYMEQLKVFGEIDRDPLERIISIAYFSLINIHDHKPNLEMEYDSHWISLKNKPKLIFDHNEMVDLAIQTLRYKAALHPIGFELLPKKFTIPQLHKLYEAIYNTLLDRRNFSRKILSTDLLIDTGLKDESSVTKKGKYYSLDKEKYKNKLNSFLNFVPDHRLGV